MAGPNSEKLFYKKQASIEKISETKSRGAEFGNALNNAIDVWITLAAHPELKVDEAAKDIMEWVQFFLGLKDEVRPPEEPGMTAEEAVEKTKELFPGSEQQSPPDPEPRCSEPQTKKIWVELHRLGYRDEKHLAVIGELLDLHRNLGSMKDLTKFQARTVIDKLIKMEAKK